MKNLMNVLLIGILMMYVSTATGTTPPVNDDVGVTYSLDQEVAEVEVTVAESTSIFALARVCTWELFYQDPVNKFFPDHDLALLNALLFEQRNTPLIERPGWKRDHIRAYAINEINAYANRSNDLSKQYKEYLILQSHYLIPYGMRC